ncbi:hypothetical protein [Streptomyces sp. NPDC001787]|nr:hypothetical protein [Streptomyces sp. BE147]
MRNGRRTTVLVAAGALVAGGVLAGGAALWSAYGGTDFPEVDPGIAASVVKADARRLHSLAAPGTDTGGITLGSDHCFPDGGTVMKLDEPVAGAYRANARWRVDGVEESDAMGAADAARAGLTEAGWRITRDDDGGEVRLEAERTATAGEGVAGRHTVGLRWTRASGRLVGTALVECAQAPGAQDDTAWEPYG